MRDSNSAVGQDSKNTKMVHTTFKNMKRFFRIRLVLLILGCVIGLVGLLLLGLSFAISSWWFQNTPPSVFSSWNDYWAGVPYQFWIYFLGYSVLSAACIINYAKIDIFWARALIVAVAICGFFHLVGIGALILHWEFWNSHLPPPSLNNATLPMSGYRGDPKSGDGTVGFAFDIFGFCFSLVVVVGSSLAMSILNVQDTKAYLEHSSRRIEESKGLKLDL